MEHNEYVKQTLPIGARVHAWNVDRKEYVPARVIAHEANSLTVRSQFLEVDTDYPLAKIAVPARVITGYDPEVSLVYPHTK